MDGGLDANSRFSVGFGRFVPIRSMDFDSARFPRNMNGNRVSSAIWVNASVQFDSPQSLISSPGREPAQTTKKLPSLNPFARRISRASVRAGCRRRYSHTADGNGRFEDRFG